MVRYQPNNILFRIASSNAISKFKSLQANSFLQVARKDLQFDTSAREVVLLEYDRFSQWLFRIERICMSATEGKMPASLRQAIKESCREEIRTVESVLESHPEVFSPKITYFVKIVHNYALAVIDERIDQTTADETVDRSFEKVVQIISDYLQHALMCLHEINNNVLVQTRPCFISIANFCVAGRDDKRFAPLEKRAEYFMSLDCGNKYVLKNYSDEINIYAEAKAYLGKYGIALLEEEQAQLARA